MPESNHKKKTRLVITIMAAVLIGFFAIGFGTLDNSDPPNSTPSTPSTSTASTAQPAEKANIIHDTTIPNPITQHGQYDNCLAISDGKTMSVSCPTAYGYVYNAVLEIPQDLISELHQKIFSLRGLSITENFDSVLMQYEKKSYVANFVGY